VRMLSSSVNAHLTPRVVTSLVALPAAYIVLVLASARLVPRADLRWHPRDGVAFLSLGAWLLLGQYAFANDWATRQDRRIADNAHWVMLSSWWEVVNGARTVRMTDKFAASDLDDFAPLGVHAPDAPAAVLRTIRNRAARQAALRRPPNIILVVLESVSARWTSLNGGPYESTPNLKAESAHALTFSNFYAHIGRSSNSLGAILLSTYPKLGFRDLTEEYPRLPGTSIAALFRDRGYRTDFVTPSDMSWAGWNDFLHLHGFDAVHDYRDLPCTEMISSWGVEDRCMVDRMLQLVDENRNRPFFLMGWTTQTHHPYEPTPGVPLLDMEKEPVPDQWELGRYLNVLHETDRHLERLFDRLRATHLDQDTIVVVVGDHGQAFGYPHDTYIQGRTIYEEDVHVPLLVWSPRFYKTSSRADAVGSQVDLAPTLASLAGVPPAADWEGRNLLGSAHPPRAYFYVAEDHFTLGVRENQWKYIYDLREGTEELYDLVTDPTEQRNVAKANPDVCARLRQRLAAWTEANRRKYEVRAQS